MYAMIAIFIYASNPVPSTSRGTLVYDNFELCKEALRKEVQNAEIVGSVEGVSVKASLKVDEFGDLYLEKINKTKKSKTYKYCNPLHKID